MGLWPWLFFVGQAIGLLAKGPVASVLTGLALFAWVAWQGAWRTTWHNIPWLRGIALLSVLVLPWYVLAEQAYPGFLRYFIVGEHWYRFTQSGWKGDLYGVAHAQPKGRIWLFALISTLPWVLASIAWGWKRWRRQAAQSVASSDRAQLHYLLCWMLAPCVFFTLSGNILPAYVLPGLPAFSLLLARQWRDAAPSSSAWSMQAVATAFCALLAPLGFAALVWFAPAQFERFSDRQLLQGLPNGQVLYLLERPDSAVFYTRGQARLVKDAAAAATLIADPAVHQLMLPVSKLGDWQARLAAAGWQETGRSALTIAFERPSSGQHPGPPR